MFIKEAVNSHLENTPRLFLGLASDQCQIRSLDLTLLLRIAQAQGSSTNVVSATMLLQMDYIIVSNKEFKLKTKKMHVILKWSLK